MAQPITKIYFKILDQDDDDFLTPQDLKTYSDKYLTIPTSLETCERLLMHVYGTNSNVEYSIEEMFNFFKNDKESEIDMKRIVEWFDKQNLEAEATVIENNMNYENFKRCVLNSVSSVKNEMNTFKK